MPHYQERRSGKERRKHRDLDRRRLADRRSPAGGSIEFLERARFRAWLEDNKEL